MRKKFDKKRKRNFNRKLNSDNHQNNNKQQYDEYSEKYRKYNKPSVENNTEFLKPFQECKKAEKLKQFSLKGLITGVPRKTVVDQLTLTFLGASGTVTGSKYLVEFGKTKVLVDCGLFQGLKELRLKNWECLPFHPKNIDAVVLTHAHLDHSGYIPLLIKYGFRGKIYCTHATYDLCQILLPDSGYLQEEEARYAKKHGYSKHKDPKPLYNQQEALNSLKYFVPVNFAEEAQISKDISFIITPIGHILGAGSVKIKAGGKSILFSGDIGRSNCPIMRPPEKVDDVDYLLVESTYGDRVHEEIDSEDILGEIINRTIKRGGSIIIPAFAVGRSQKILYYVLRLKQKGKIPDIPIFLDSPMSIRVTHLLDDYADQHRLTKQECFDIYKSVRFTVTTEQSKAINDFNYPSVIISASGMVTGGRVLHHIARLAPSYKNTILFAGYQAMGTRGRTITDGKKEVKIHGKMVPIEAEVDILHNMSSHGDYREILNWLKGFNRPPKKTFIIHGEPEASLSFEHKIKEELRWETNIPKYLQKEKL
jgi:metallo-beta-lactamase family protein